MIAQKNPPCLYCNNTGRTKEDPFNCKHCNRSYYNPTNESNQTKDKLSEIERLPYFNKIRQYSKSYINTLIKTKGIKLTNRQLEKLSVMDILKTYILNNNIFNTQLMIYLEPIIYETGIYWVYNIQYNKLGENFNINNILYNLNLLSLETLSTSSILEEDIVFIELHTLSQNVINLLSEITIIRKRKNLPTIILTTKSHKDICIYTNNFSQINPSCVIDTCSTLSSAQTSPAENMETFYNQLNPNFTIGSFI